MSASGSTPATSDATSGFRRDLGLTDFTLLVVGAIVGADVYVVAALGAAALGPAQLVAWGAAGLLAGFIALAFVQCAVIDSGAGGSYAYVRDAFGAPWGFCAGWALYAGEWVALPVFPLAFVTYLDRLVPGGISTPEEVGVKIALIAIVTATNLAGVRQGARLNDVLTLAKLVPLLALIALALLVLGFHPGVVSGHVEPFAPKGWGGFGTAIVPIFWAFAGFELAVLPAGEVRNPLRNVPAGLIAGVALASAFYLLTAFAVVALLPWRDAAASSSPLAAAMNAGLGDLGGLRGGAAFMSIGALISIAGVFDVFTLGVARLSYALAADGLFPPAFGRIHPRFRTPHVGLAFQAAAALAGSTLFGLRGLIALSVFFLGLNYALTALAALRLARRHPDRALRVPALAPALVVAALGGAYLATQAGRAQIAVGIGVMALGFVVFAVRRGRWHAFPREAEATGRRALAGAQHDYHWLRRSARRALRLRRTP